RESEPRAPGAAGTGAAHRDVRDRRAREPRDLADGSRVGVQQAAIATGIVSLVSLGPQIAPCICGTPAVPGGRRPLPLRLVVEQRNGFGWVSGHGGPGVK